MWTMKFEVQYDILHVTISFIKYDSKIDNLFIMFSKSQRMHRLKINYIIYVGHRSNLHGGLSDILDRNMLWAPDSTWIGSGPSTPVSAWSGRSSGALRVKVLTSAAVAYIHAFWYFTATSLWTKPFTYATQTIIRPFMISKPCETPKTSARQTHLIWSEVVAAPTKPIWLKKQVLMIIIRFNGHDQKYVSETFAIWGMDFRCSKSSGKCKWRSPLPFVFSSATFASWERLMSNIGMSKQMFKICIKSN